MRPMSLRPTIDGDVEVFRRECAGDRLEEQTYRPIEAGRPVLLDQKREHWTFVLDAQPAGWVSLFALNSRNRSAEFGYGIVSSQRRKGIGKLMLSAAFDLFFGQMDLGKAYCQTASFNVASVRLLESLGLTRDAVLRAHHELDGELHDEYIYSILKSEWARDRAAKSASP
jgi:ribosomal-protein-alanine N-acetyltransferase